jgi:glutamate-1-semialdehyde 2,1-aminomutase
VVQDISWIVDKVEAMLTTPVERDSKQLDRIIEDEQERFVERMKGSAAQSAAARKVLAGGATSSWQLSDPHAVWISHGKGSRMWDVDGNEYVDLHGGYGVMLAGHAHPAIVRAVQDRITMGTHFAQPVADAVVVASELVERYGLALWRFGNSGTEATMDAIHLMRAYTGRDIIIKFEGGYHGHHDSAQVSTWNGEGLGDASRPKSQAATAGIPDAIVQLTRVATFNDLDSVQTIFDEYRGRVAGVILEPVLMNCGVVPPIDGFLEGLRKMTEENGALLTFDEVKTGLTLGRGGATRRYGVTPDIVCLAKALGGGVAVSAVGGSEKVMSLIIDGVYDQVGTFNGNPLAMAAARAMLTEVLVPETYEHLERIEGRMSDGARKLIDSYELPAYVTNVGAKGSITYAPNRVTNYRDFLAVDGRYAYAAWLTQFNRGVFLPPWGKGEQWLVSVQHDDADVDLYLETLEEFARALRG